MKRVWNYINSRPLNPVILILFFTIIGGIIFYIFRESEDAFDYFFTCFGTGISIAVFQCAYIQNQIQKDNIKIQLFDKRYSVYRSVMDTITIIKRDNWDRCILFDNIDTNRQILQIEENLFKSVHLSACLFDADLYTKLIDINNAFCKVAEAYKKMLINNLKSLKTEEEKQEFIALFRSHILSQEETISKDYDKELKEKFPQVYISLMEFNNECSTYISFIENSGIIKDFKEYIIIDRLDK